MKIQVFDVESDGLLDEATKIHCLSYRDVGTKAIHSTTKYKNITKFAQDADVLVGHNIARYDIPLLEKILGIEVKGKKIVDTLALSWYIYSKRLQHGLESFGEEYGMPKVKVDDWENLTPEDYIKRCERDVEINYRLWTKQFKFLVNLYGSEEEAWRCIDYLSFKMRCARLQEKSGWKLDKERCINGRDELLFLKQSKTEELKAVMPQVPKYIKKSKPKKPYKQDGTLSKAGEDWYAVLKEQALPDDTLEVQVLKGYDVPKPSSPAQVKAFLTTLGWKPDEFKYDKDKVTGKLRKIPQVNTQVPGKWGLTESVKRIVEKHPELEPLDGLSVISHRLGILEGFLAVEKDGYVKAEIQGLTNTLRFKHKVCLNLPKPTAPYGELIRGCLITEDTQEQCGSDMSSLEDKIKQHFLYKHDPEYVKEMQTEGYDPHTSLAVFAGAITLEQEQGFKDGLPKVKPLVAAIRSVYKTTNYACQYGAGGFKVALSAGIPTKEGEELHAAYWKKNWAINAVADEQIVKTCGGQQWLYNPISRIWYSLRHKKDIFSTLCQGSGVYCFDTWVKHVLHMRPQLTAQFHDEIVLCLLKGFRDKCKALLLQAIEKTNKELNLNVQLGVDVQFGDNYAQIH